MSSRVLDILSDEVFQTSESGTAGSVSNLSRLYQHIVIIGDPHLPGRNVLAKTKVLQTLNAWEDVDLVVVLGDLCADLGTAEEAAYARRFFRSLRKPVTFIHGNHDYVYCDERNAAGKRIKGSPDLRQYKLKRFQELFGLKKVYYSKRCGDYLLIFLSADDLHADSSTWISQTQLEWWQEEMTKHQELPTVVFCHAPLQGTVSIVREGTAALAGMTGALLFGGLEWALPIGWIGDRMVKRLEEQEMAQPQDQIRQIIRANPQLFMWVSGHFHVAATNRNFNSADNVYRGQVTLVHNSDMDGWGFRAPWRGWRHDTIWTNSLYFYPDRVDVKTYDHTRGTWLDNMNRSVARGVKR